MNPRTAPYRPSRFAGVAMILSLIAPPPYALAASRSKAGADAKTLHALSRLTYGPRTGDIEAVRQIGLEKWIERQLQPSTLPESPILEEKLRPLDTLRLSSEELVAQYPPPQLIVAIATGRVPLPSDPAQRAYLERLAARYKDRISKKNKDGNPRPKALQPAEKPSLNAILTREEAQQIRRGTAEERMAFLRQLQPAKLEAVLSALSDGQRRALFAYSPVELRRKMLREIAPQQVIQHDLWESKIYRAIYSNRQLEELLTDFWFNHFNVYLDKGADRFLVTSYERDAIRPHVLGKFRDLLQATAQHPAMLFYLDNWQSVSPESDMGRRMKKAAPKRARGLNENYGRELLELHTLGVDGGYTQKDVQEVARCFTGWTINEPYRGAKFHFAERVHDRGEKTVLGMKIPAGGGQEDGLKVLDIVATHPSTARFISFKLAQRFVGDQPPKTLVEAMAKTFQKTGGDLRETMRTMLRSKEFWGPPAIRAKVKTPLEMVASSARATGADVTFAYGLANQIAEMGQPLYRKQEPTGYSSLAEDWVNSSALLARMNFALALAQNKLPGTKVDTAALPSESGSLAAALLFRPPTQQTRDALARAVAEKKEPAVLAALVLGSPEFQRR